MKRFNNTRNKRHGNKPKSNSLVTLEFKCNCLKAHNDIDKHKKNFTNCLNDVIKKKTIIPQ